VVSDKPQTEKKTMGLWDRDVCEIFIAPDEHAIERYFEFEAAPYRRVGGRGDSLVADQAGIRLGISLGNELCRDEDNHQRRSRQ
jgi:hypothetical protein